MAEAVERNHHMVRHGGHNEQVLIDDVLALDEYKTWIITYLLVVVGFSRLFDVLARMRREAANSVAIAACGPR